MTERALATIRKIEEIAPIEGADKIEVARVGGWRVVVKKGDFQVGHLAVFCEIDSFIPHDLAPFLTRPGKEPAEFNGVKGQRLRTVRLRGQISQGLLLPIVDTCGMDFLGFTVNGLFFTGNYNEGDNLTENLNVQKWEKPIPAKMQGIMRGNFPSCVPKTDQERVQNIKTSVLEQYIGHRFEVTEKMDGSSCTMLLDTEGVFHVCSRNFDLERDESNVYWQMAIKYDVEAKLRSMGEYGFGLAIQGEVCGPGIQGNQYDFTEPDFFVYDIYSAVDTTYCPPCIRQTLVDSLGLKHVPVIVMGKLRSASRDVLLEDAKDRSVFNETPREGLVFKLNSNDRFSFKVISNDWLENYE
jgi:RNA ligase (TIGR02306 family)